MAKLLDHMFLYQNEQPVLAISIKTDVNNFRKHIAECSSKISSYLNKLGKYTSDVPFIVYNNSDLQDMDVDVCFPTGNPLPGYGDIRFEMAPASKIVMCMLQGDHFERKNVYDNLLEWLANNGYEYNNRTCEYFYMKEGDREDGQLYTKVTMAIK